MLRTFRSVHRFTGALLFVFFFIISISGLLLGWKKHSNGVILPISHVGTSTDLEDWLPLDTLQAIAFQTLHDSVSADLSLDLQRIDARPEKGMVKFVFDYHYWGIQLDGATGKLLHIERRRSDLVENIHDGSILDIVLRTGGETIKLVYTTIMGVALFVFTTTGFWLWLGPKHMRRTRRRRASPPSGDGFPARAPTLPAPHTRSERR